MPVLITGSGPRVRGELWDIDVSLDALEMATGHWPLTYQWPDRARGLLLAPKCYVREPVTGTMPMTGVQSMCDSKLGHRRSQYNDHN